ncbi:hypothetical protein ABFY27_06205 [Akkermansia massiliensis]
MKWFVTIACWCVGTLMAADVPIKSASYSGTSLKGPVIGLSSMGLVRGSLLISPRQASCCIACFPVLKCWLRNSRNRN